MRIPKFIVNMCVCVLLPEVPENLHCTHSLMLKHALTHTHREYERDV